MEGRSTEVHNILEILLMSTHDIPHPHTYLPTYYKCCPMLLRGITLAQLYPCSAQESCTSSPALTIFLVCALSRETIRGHDAHAARQPVLGDIPGSLHLCVSGGALHAGKGMPRAAWLVLDHTIFGSLAHSLPPAAFSRNKALYGQGECNQTEAAK